MQNLVTLTTSDITKATPITTSKIIADNFDKRHSVIARKIDRLILNESSKLFTEHQMVTSEYVDLTGKANKQYSLNRDQAMFIIMGLTGDKAIYSKEQFIAAFNFMERELLTRSETRYIGKQVRHSLTDSIKDNLDDNTNHKKFAYSNYTKLIYKIALGTTVKKYKEKHRIGVNENVRNHLSINQLDRIQSMETKVADYIEALKSVLTDKEIYEKIKVILTK